LPRAVLGCELVIGTSLGALLRWQGQSLAEREPVDDNSAELVPLEVSDSRGHFTDRLSLEFERILCRIERVDAPRSIARVVGIGIASLPACPFEHLD